MMVNDLTVYVIFKVGSGIVTSVTINIINLKFLIGRIDSFGYIFVITHFLNCLDPTWSWSCLVSMILLLSKLIILFDFMIQRFIFSLDWLLSCKSQCLHPQATMVVIFQQWSELIQTHCSIFVVIILLKLLFSYFFIILFLNQIHKI